MKKQNLFIVSCLLVLSLLIPTFLSAKETRALDKSYISYVKMESIVDGIAPFDKNDSPGNDSGESNGIVRSFDDIFYTINYITALKENKPLNKAYLMVEIELNCTKDAATFNLENMGWMLDPVISERNGKQVLTGKRLLENTADTNAIPGQGTLSLGIKVRAASNGLNINPKIKVWMEGNKDSEKQLLEANTKVSAEPRYNIVLKRRESTNFRGWYNTVTGEEGAAGDNQSVFGRIQGYAATLQLYNDSREKGLKGIEIPNGPICFDLELNELRADGSNTSLITDPNYKPLLWDIKPNIYGIRGSKNRNMMWKYDTTSSHGVGIAPRANGGGYEACFNSGSWDFEQIGDTKYRVTVKDYLFSEDFTFPTDYTAVSHNESSRVYWENEGCFSAGYFQVVCRFPESVSNTESVYLKVKTSNLKASSISGTPIDKDKKDSDNEITGTISLYPSGNIFKELIAEDKSVACSSSIFYEGDSSAYRGDIVYFGSTLSRSKDYPPQSFNYLVKFNDKGFEYYNDPNYKLNIYTYVPQATKQGNNKILFGIKKDKSGWSSKAEMIATKEKDLIYYSNYDDLKRDNATCVAVLLENRDSYLIPGAWDHFCEYSFPFKVKDNAQINQTYEYISDFDCWDYPITFTREGNPNANPPTPSAYIHTNEYIKSEYDKNGNILEGTHYPGYRDGQTYLIVEYKAQVSKQIEDFFENERKTSYDMDKNERTVQFSLTAGTTANIRGDSNRTTNLYLYDRLPADLHYIEKSASYNNKEITPEITINSDGTTLLKWTLPNVGINKTLPKIKYSCSIGAAGTNHDVKNNQVIKSSVYINGDEDHRKELNLFNNRAEVSFNVIKLNSLSILKSTSTSNVGIGQNFSYDLQYANNAKNKKENTFIYDILPYNGDARGTKYSGDYNLDKITIDFSNAKGTLTDYIKEGTNLLVSTSKDIQTNNFNEISNYKNWVEIKGEVKGNVVEFTNLPKGIKAFGISFDINGFEQLSVHLDFSTSGNQKEFDKYVNNFYQKNQDVKVPVISNTSAVQILGHLNIKKIWNDDNNKYHTRPDTLNIILYQNGIEYRKMEVQTGTSKDEVLNIKVENVPICDKNGNDYLYTVAEESSEYLEAFYKEPEYNQKELTIKNTGIWAKTNGDSINNYAVKINKFILNKEGEPVTDTDYKKINLEPKDYDFGIRLMQLNRNLVPQRENGKLVLKEEYNGYSGDIFNGYISEDNSFIIDKLPVGKYEIVENPRLYFKFLNLNKKSSSNGASFEYKDGKYYITISDFTNKDEYIELDSYSQIEYDRHYVDISSKNNLFNPN